jgi:AbrB family looped-hinge helix DNA binding protein
VNVLEIEEREIQRGGRVTIPKSLREQYGLEEGTVVKFRSRDGKIEIEPPTRLTSLIGLIKTGEPCDNPKEEARGFMKKRLVKEVE